MLRRSDRNRAHARCGARTRRTIGRDVVSYTVQTGSRQDTYYRVAVELNTGKKLTIADSLRGAKAAEALLATIAEQTGYPR